MPATTSHRQSTVRSYFKAKIATVLVPLMALTLASCSDITPQERNLSAVVAYYANDTYLEFKHAFVDLNNDGVNDAVVLLQGRNWCGSAGCTLLVLHGQGEGYRVVSKSMVAREPVRISESISNGWQDIIVHSDGTEKLLRFAQRAYPADASMEPTATQEQVDSAKTVLQ